MGRHHCDTLATRTSRAIIALACTLTGLAWIAAPSHAQVSFTQITDLSNPIVAEGGHNAGHYFGCSWVDFDGDDDQDLFVDLDELYENQGAGTFVKRIDTGIGSMQVAGAGFSMHGNSWVDYDNDGDLDAHLAGQMSFLYENDGGTFTPITTGDIGDGFANRGWTCAWADYSGDGAVDLVIVHPAGFVPGGSTPNHQYESDGAPHYTMTRVTTGPIVSGFDSYTVGSWSDFDDDGDMDFFIGSGPANGTLQADNLYRNQLTQLGTPLFERNFDAPIGTDLQDGQLWNWIDYDNDGDLDGYLTNWGGSTGGLVNRLYRNDGGSGFISILSGSIVTDADVSLSSVWQDFDNDGDLDCFVANDAGGTDRYYDNNGDGTFTRVDGLAVSVTGSRRGASAADYDDDGFMDLFVNGSGTLRALYRNTSANGNNWISITAEGTDSNRSAIGAKVRMLATIDGSPTWQMREISAQNTFNGHNSLRAHFGLGDASIIDALVIDWPSGNQTNLEDVSINQFMRVVEVGSTGIAALAAPARVGLALRNQPNPFNPFTTIHFELPSDARLTLMIHDVNGRAVTTLIDGESRAAGAHTLTWDGRGATGSSMPSGIYHLRLDTGATVEQSRMVLVR